MAEIEIPYPRPQRLLSVDPGSRAGVAVFNQVEGRFCFELDGAWEVANRVKVVSETIAKFADDPRPGAVVLERQFFRIKAGPKGAPKEVQIHGHEALLRYRHEWEILAEVFGLSSVLIYPASWQSKMLPFKGRQKKDGEGNKVGPNTKEQALMACNQYWPHLEELWLFHENARDAALLGRFYTTLLEK